MEDKDEIGKMLAFVQTGLHDQINALKGDVEDTKKDVEAMLELGATLEDKTTFREDAMKSVLDILKGHNIKIFKTQQIQTLTITTISWTTLIIIALTMANENNRGAWLILILEPTKNLRETYEELLGANNIRRITRIIKGFAIKNDNISKRFKELRGV